MSKWQYAAVLTLALAAVAVPAWASSEGGVQQASDRVDSSPGQMSPANGPSGGDPLSLASPKARQQLDDAIQCMTDKGFGTPTADGGVFISKSETETSAFRQAADECGLPPRPTDVPPRPTSAEIDAALKCMADHGFGTPTADGGVSISKSESQTPGFRQAAEDCGLPRPRTAARRWDYRRGFGLVGACSLPRSMPSGRP